MKTIQPNTLKVIRDLERAEVGPYAVDCRRALRDERFAILAALKFGDARIGASTREAARMVGGTVRGVQGE